ncbi:hypothetical protein HDR67_03965 [bacterium]|nr:hypothetical protein [bacterium]
MGKNSVKRTTTVQQKNKGLFLAFKIIIFVAFVFVVTCTAIYLLEMGHENRSYFTIHFALPIVLLFVGVIAIFLSMLSRLSLSGESKGDMLMIGVGLVLFLCSIITLALSYF